MEVVSRILRMRAVVDDLRRLGRKVGFVPTMGSLHEGHLSLVRLVRERGAECVASIFVNPLQFGPAEDFERYPRDLTADCELLTKEGVVAVFAPEVREIYPQGFATHVDAGEMAEMLTGAHRPGHFRGVTTVVLKLLNIVRPDFAVFGWKDAQQLLVIQRMQRDLDLDVEIVGAPTIRESDGLAASSRNVLLDEAARCAGAAIFRSLAAAERLVSEGERIPQHVEEAAQAVLATEERITVDYVRVVSGRDLSELKRVAGPVLVLVSAKVKVDGRPPVLLIDNIRLDVPDEIAPARRA